MIGAVLPEHQQGEAEEQDGEIEAADEDGGDRRGEAAATMPPTEE